MVVPATLGCSWKCRCGICTACKDGAPPEVLTMAIAGIGGTGSCSDPCSDLDGTYEFGLTIACEVVASGEYAGWHRTEWVISGGGGFCGSSFSGSIQVLWDPATGDRTIIVIFGVSPGGDLAATYMLEETGQSEPFDCQAFAGKVIPRVEDVSSPCTAPASVAISV